MALPLFPSKAPSYSAIPSRGEASGEAGGEEEEARVPTDFSAASKKKKTISFGDRDENDDEEEDVAERPGGNEGDSNANAPRTATFVIPSLFEDLTNDAHRRELAEVYRQASVHPERGISHKRDRISLRWLRYYYSRGHRWMVYIALLVMCSLAFFEQRRRLSWPPATPNSVAGNNNNPIPLPEDLIMDIEGGEDTFLRRDPELRVVETACFAILLWSIWVKRRFMGPKHFSRDSSAVFHLVILIVLALDFIYAPFENVPVTSSPEVASSSPVSTSLEDAAATSAKRMESASTLRIGMRLIFPASHRILRFLRPFLIFEYSPSTRKRAVNVVYSVANAYWTFLLLFFNTVIFTIAGSVLFHNTEEGRVWFSTFEQGYVTLTVLQTTCNFPSVLMPAYVEDRKTSLFFVAYLILGYFFLLNLVLGAIYGEVKPLLKAQAEEDLMRVRIAEMAKAEVVKTIASPSLRPRRNSIPATIANPAGELDATTSHAPNQLDPNESRSREERRRDRREKRMRIDKYRLGATRVLTLVLSVNFAATVWLLHYDFKNFIEFGGDYKRVFLFWNLVVLSCYAFETLVVKLAWVYQMRMGDFLDDAWHVLDVLLLLANFIGIFGYLLSLVDYRSSSLLRYSINLRLLKNLRLFKLGLKRITTLFEVISGVIGVLLVCFLSVSILVSSSILGNVRPRIYNANDFSDLVAALLTLFQLAVVNDWNFTMNGYAEALLRALSSPKSLNPEGGPDLTEEDVRRNEVASFVASFSTTFFIAWWVLSSLVLFNTIVSLILEGFNADNDPRLRQGLPSARRVGRRDLAMLDSGGSITDIDSFPSVAKESALGDDEDDERRTASEDDSEEDNEEDDNARREWRLRRRARLDVESGMRDEPSFMLSRLSFFNFVKAEEPTRGEVEREMRRRL